MISQELLRLFSLSKCAAISEGLSERAVSILDDGSVEIDLIGERDEPQTFVYFILCNEFVKIGFSNDPLKRMESMVTRNPYPLRIALAIYGGKETEKSLHADFMEYHHHREWFRYEGELKDWIEARL